MALLGVASVLVAGRAQCSSVSDGNAGMAALTSGQFHRAIDLFTHALKAGRLNSADRELAYVKRGEAELALNLLDSSLKDFRRALQLKPDDAEATQFLQIAEATLVQPKANSRVQPSRREQQLQLAWGAMARLPGHTWLEIDDKPIMYFQYQWEQPWKVLIFTGMDRNGNPFAGQYQLDEATSQISGVAVFKGQAGQSQVQTTDDTWIDEGHSGDSQTRQTFQVSGPTSFQLSQTWLKGGKWRQGKPMQYVQVSPTIIAGLGWTTAPPQPSFWAGMLSSLKAGAIAGFQC